MAEPRRIRVTIERLMLSGVRPGERAALARALERSLRGALESKGLPAAAGTDAPSLALRVPGSGEDARALGAAAGHSVHGALVRAVGGRSRR